MNVKIITKTDEDYQDSLAIVIDGAGVAYFYDGEPEDNSLGRNFSDCYSIDSLMRRAYEAGRNGEEFNVEYVEEDAE